MLKPNPIRRRHMGDWSWVLGGGNPGAVREWVAVCPECGAEITHHRGHPDYARATRKNTKDALYRHVQKEHKPGSVGR